MCNEYNDNLLEVKDLQIRYVTDEETVCAVNGVSFMLKKGESIGLVGETGAGKTTTALGIMGLVPDPPGEVVGGSILFEGTDILKLSEKQLRKIRGGKISMVFQDPMTSLNPVLTVGEQIEEVVLLHNEIPKSEAHKRAVEMLELVGIPGTRHSDYPHQFSGGMKQRVVIAIALACNPQLLIADEPTTALDVTIQAQVLELMRNLKREYGTAMILITHDLGVVAKICDKVAIIYAGEVVESGPLKDIYLDKRHPYTIGLFNSLPDIEKESQTLQVIQGMVPDPAHLPEGCKFHPRCPYRNEACDNGMVLLYEVSPGHMVRCNRFVGTEV
ncbi:MAG TPA: ABC transporter ATP-binding protein [Clostridia bacterium]|nr:ABC transporter ATP-binding protein [Clostridia bacterium]